MRSFATLAVLVLPFFASVLAAEPASPTKQGDESNSIYASAHDAFQDLLNALPEESLQAALSGLKDFKHGIFESHHRGVEQVHDKNPALATRLIVAAVQDLKKRQTPSNGTTTTPPSSPPQSSNRPPAGSSQASSPAQSSNASPPAQSSANNPPAPSSTERAVIVNVPQTTTNAQGQTVVQTTSVLSQVTASVPVTIVRTDSQGQTVTTTENRPAVIRTTTDSQGRTTVTTSAALFAPTAGEVRTETDQRGSTFLTTYTPGGGKISSIKLITTTGADGRPSVITSYTFVDPAATPTGQANGNAGQTTGRPGLQTNAAKANRAYDYAVLGGAVGGAFAMFL